MRKTQGRKKTRKVGSNREPVDAIMREVQLFKAARLAQLGQFIDLELKKIQASAIVYEACLLHMAVEGSLLPEMPAKV